MPGGLVATALAWRLYGLHGWAKFSGNSGIEAWFVCGALSTHRKLMRIHSLVHSFLIPSEEQGSTLHWNPHESSLSVCPSLKEKPMYRQVEIEGHPDQ